MDISKFSLTFVILILDVSNCEIQENVTNSRILSRVTRVMGGNPETIVNYPYMVFIFEYSLQSHCSGTIIDKEWILTAAHCVKKEKKYIIAAGTSEISRHDYTLHAAIHLHIPHGYNNVTLKNDIALIKIKPSIEMDAKHQPIRLIEPDDNIVTGELALVVGYGLSGSGPNDLTSTFKLHSASMPLVTQDSLYYYYNMVRRFYVGPEMIGAGFVGRTTGINPCPGDSGGPLIYNGRLIGITSTVSNCKRKVQVPNGFTRVSAYLGWINETMSIYGDSHGSENDKCIQMII